MSALQLSEELLFAVKKSSNHNSIASDLEKVNLMSLNSDDKRLTFWINIYNAFYQLLEKESIKRNEIFKIKNISLGGKNFSLDDIEHGILRKRKWKFSLGYLPSPFYPAFIKHLEVDSLDYRIHFALNCGAKSCPAIAFYHHVSIQKELDLATTSFLEQEITIDHGTKTIILNKIFLWYKADFGGTKGIINLISHHLKINDLKNYTTKYRDYDYTPSTNYRI